MNLSYCRFTITKNYVGFLSFTYYHFDLGLGTVPSFTARLVSSSLSYCTTEFVMKETNYWVKLIVKTSEVWLQQESSWILNRPIEVINRIIIYAEFYC